MTGRPDLVVLPRLDHTQTRAAIDRVRAAGDDILSLARTQPRQADGLTWPATGPARISTAQLSALRQALLAAAEDAGYPEPRRRTDFDAPAARIIRSHLHISAHEASTNAAWAFLNCCWLLDLSAWRWGSDGEDRHFNGDINRDTFRRLWWRAELLGDDFDLAQLLEDEQVSLAERPQLPPNLVRVLAREFLAHDALSRPGIQRTHLMRDVAKRMLRRTPLIEFAALDTAALRHEVQHALALSVRALTGTSGSTVMSQQPTGVSEPSHGVQQLPPTHTPGRPAATPARPAHVTTELQATVEEQAALALVRRAGRVTAVQLAELLRTETSRARAVLQGLVTGGQLHQHGRTRGTYYTSGADQTTAADVPNTTNEQTEILRGALATNRAADTRLPDLIAAELLEPGDILRATTSGRLSRVSVRADGTLAPLGRSGTVYDLTQATQAMTNSRLDPLDVWSVERRGRLQPLRNLRAAQKASQTPSDAQATKPSSSADQAALYILTEVGATQKLITYAALNDRIAAAIETPPLRLTTAAGRSRLDGIITRVSDTTYSKEEVLLSALVCLDDQNAPVVAFHRQAVRLGLLSPRADSWRLTEFWAAQIARAYNVIAADHRHRSGASGPARHDDNSVRPADLPAP